MQYQKSGEQIRPRYCVPYEIGRYCQLRRNELTVECGCDKQLSLARQNVSEAFHCAFSVARGGAAAAAIQNIQQPISDDS